MKNRIDMKRANLLVFAILLLAACQQQPSNPQDQLAALQKQKEQIDQKIATLEKSMGKQAAPVKVTPVNVMSMQPTAFSSFIEVQGKVDAQQNVNVTPEAAAVVTSIKVHVGQQVHKGQVLATLDDQVLRQGIAQLQTQLAFTKNLYERQKNLWAQKIGSEVQLLTAKNNYENVQKQLQVQEAQQDLYTIKSPIDGTVDEMDLKIGQAVSPGMPTIRVVNLQDLKVVGQLGESYLSKVKTGGPVELVFPDENDTLRTKLSYVSQVVDPASRSFDVEIRLPSNRVYHPNMLAIIRVLGYINPKAMVVPISVVQHALTGDYVYVAKDNKAHQVPVVIGHTYGGNAEIIQGLQPGDQLITVGFDNLNEGDTLQIQ